MMITADAKTDRPVPQIVNFRIRHRKKIQINHIIERPDRTAYKKSEFTAVRHINFPQGKACQIAYHKISRLCHSHNDGFSIHRLNPLLQSFHRTHILCNLRTQITAVNHTAVTVRVGPVNRIPVEGKRCSGLHCAF